MRPIIVSLFSLLILSMIAIGQTQVEPPCPQISVNGPAGVSDIDKPILYIATIGKEIDQYAPVYRWKAINGEIVDGQGSTGVRVRFNDFDRGLTVTLEIDGLPPQCAKSASETMSIDLPPQPSLLDTIVGPIATISETRIDKIIQAAKDNPNARLYIFISGTMRNADATIKTKQKILLNKIGRKFGEDNRVTFVVSDKTDDRVLAWLVPAGAENPEL